MTKSALSTAIVTTTTAAEAATTTMEKPMYELSFEQVNVMASFITSQAESGNKIELGYLTAVLAEDMLGTICFEPTIEVFQKELEDTVAIGRYTVFHDDVGNNASNRSLSLDAVLLATGYDKESWLIRMQVVKYVDGKVYPGNLLERALKTNKQTYMLCKEPPVHTRRNLWVGKRPKAKPSMLRRNVINYLQCQPLETNHEYAELASTVYNTIKAKKAKDRTDKENVLFGEAYAIQGALNTHGVVYAEYMLDWRGRFNQANYQGGNHQAGDMVRSFIDYHGDFTGYCPKYAKACLLMELSDMCSLTPTEIYGMMDAIMANKAQFITAWYADMSDLQSKIKKPWSFVKAVSYLYELKMGNKPNIKMGFGLDAKCSGPQIGAILCGDEALMKACGLLLDGEKGGKDPYEMAIERLFEATGILVTRSGIKKSYMAVFYGAGFASLMNKVTTENIDGFHDTLYADGINEETAQALYDAISSTFGRMLALMNILKDADRRNPYSTEDMVITMPDGFEINFRERGVIDIEDPKGNLTRKYMNTVKGNITEAQYVALDSKAAFKVYIDGKKKAAFSKPGCPTKHKDMAEEARKTWVNFIQGNDALLASLIIDNCRMAGVTHVSAVHDCFRVSIMDYAKLPGIISDAYMELYGDPEGKPTVRLPHGTDMLGLLKKAVDAVSLEDEVMPEKAFTQFFKTSTTASGKVRKVDIRERILNKDSYYFAK